MTPRRYLSLSALIICAACWTPLLRADETPASAPAAAASAPAEAATSSASSGAAPAKAPAHVASELVCRREAPTGSHLGRRVCRTRAEIDADVAQSREAMGVLGRPGGGAAGGG